LKPRNFETRVFDMSVNAKKSMGWTSVLILLGLVALFAGAKWLVVLIPAAMMVWYGVGPTLRSGRN
jgi:hypothetical protein